MTDQQDREFVDDKPGLDSLFEDLFGLNVRGLSTIGQLFAVPKQVFESARVSDWRRKYTPTIRLTFSIITAYMLLSFFWAAEDGMMYQSLLASLTESMSTLDEPPTAEELPDMVTAALAAYSFVYPFVYMFIHGAVASLVFFWGRGTGWVTRVRLYFGLLAVGMSLSLLSILAIPFLSLDLLLPFTMIGLSAALLAYGLTFARGTWGIHSAAGTIFRAIIIAIIITGVDVIVGGLSGFAAGLWISGFRG